MLVETKVSQLICIRINWVPNSHDYGKITHIYFKAEAAKILNNQDTYISIFSCAQKPQLNWLKENKDVKILYESIPAYNVNHPNRTKEFGNVVVVWEYTGKETESAQQLRALVAPQMEKILAKTTLSSSQTEGNIASPAVTTAMQDYSLA